MPGGVRLFPALSRWATVDAPLSGALKIHCVSSRQRRRFNRSPQHKPWDKMHKTLTAPEAGRFNQFPLRKLWDPYAYSQRCRTGLRLIRPFQGLLKLHFARRATTLMGKWRTFEPSHLRAFTLPAGHITLLMTNT